MRRILLYFVETCIWQLITLEGGWIVFIKIRNVSNLQEYKYAQNKTQKLQTQTQNILSWLNPLDLHPVPSYPTWDFPYPWFWELKNQNKYTNWQTTLPISTSLHREDLLPFTKYKNLQPISLECEVQIVLCWG